MKHILVAVVMAVVAGTASASPNPVSVFSPPSSVDRGLVARTVSQDSRSGGAVPAATALNPVVGSLQRTGHFSHPITHKTKYSQTVYNPLLGQFGTRTLRR